MMEKLRGHIRALSASLLDDDHRMNIQFLSVYFILALVSAFMTVVNVLTQKHDLMLSTLLFTIASAGNLLLSLRGEKGRRAASLLFCAEITALFVFFIVSGEPEGFSAIWVCMVPASGLLLFGRKRGSALCALEFVVTVFFLHAPLGRSLLHYRYTDSFLLRFPMLYLAFFAVAFFLETIRAATYDALVESRRQYQHLYSHDALTGVYNRYGFNERMDALLRAPLENGLALLILDIDYFKNVNDRYGHPAGDVVLREVAAVLVRSGGARAVVCRWGGEEFAVIIEDAEAAQSIAAQMLCGIRTLAVTIGGETVHVTASIGMTVVAPHEAAAPALLVAQADRCLYRAKATGRDRIVDMAYPKAQPS